MSDKNVILITGASSGIGLELSQQYIKTGKKIIALDINQPEYKHERYFFYKVDVTQEKIFEDSVQKACQEIGTPYFWYNNAGIAAIDKFDKIDSEKFNKILDVNIKGVSNGTRLALKIWKEESGHIVNMASMAGLIAPPFLSAYVTSKHAIVGLTRSLRAECSQLGRPIRFTLVCPWFANTTMLQTNSDFQIPKWLQWSVLEIPELVKETISGVEREKKEIYPGVQGKFMEKINRMYPGLLETSSRLMLAKDLREALGFKSLFK